MHKILKIVITKVSKKDKSKNDCSGYIKGKKSCKRPVKYRWSGGFFFCEVCHEKELEGYITSDDENESDSEKDSESGTSESESESDSEKDSESDSD